MAQTFGYPTSRTFTFLGCPVQFFQRQVIQDCAGQGAALFNILVPRHLSVYRGELQHVPRAGPDAGSKCAAGQLADLLDGHHHVRQSGRAENVQRSAGQLPELLQHSGCFDDLGAPISNPAPDPNNNSFIYQRFQRGIMHYIQGTGTESILIADYLKALILNQNVPTDLGAEATAQNSPYLASYCPGQPLWMCKPNQVPGTDYTFAFVQG